MEKFGSYLISKEQRLIVEYHAGDITVNDFIDSRKIISSDGEYNPNFDLIMDYREANMVVDKIDVDLFVDFFRKYSSILGSRKSAYLTTAPKQVVITTLFSSAISDLDVRPKTFSTLKGVVNWIVKKDLDTTKLREIIEQLKTRPNTLYRL